MVAGTLIRFFRLPTEERLRSICRGEYNQELISYLGEAAFQDYLKIATRTIERLNEKHLAPRATENLIFVPGVMGSLLYSETYAGVWWIDPRTRAHINDLRLSPDGVQDAHPDHQIKPFTVDTLYEPFLAAVLRTKDFRHVVFAYDWRKPLVNSAPMLRDRICQLHAKSHRPIHLVAHSMGGLMVRVTLMQYGAELWDKIGRIVFVGTPHYGSPAIASYLKNHLWGFDLLELLGNLYLSRETFRSLWGVLSMLPAPEGIYPGTRNSQLPVEATDDSYHHPCANFDMYDAASWKLDLGTRDEPLGLEPQAQLQRVLDAAKRMYEELYHAHWQLDREHRHRMAVIAGVGVKTLFRLEQKKGFLGSWDEIDKITDRKNDNPHREGDGRVPLASAELEDVGATRYIKGLHAELPMIPAVYEDAFRWLRDEKMTLPISPAEALSKHLGPDINISETPKLTSPFARKSGVISPDLWSISPLSNTQLSELERELASGGFPDFVKARLL
jgi:pimeloyl-ACP methyl ester carboxylesterase